MSKEQTSKTGHSSLSGLVESIYNRLEADKAPDDKNLEEFLGTLREVLTNKLSTTQDFRLRASNVGEKCTRKLWLQKHKPHMMEKLKPWVRMKFLYGDIIEALVLFLAKEAGYKVTGQQQESEIDGVKGSIDGFIDGHLVDVKSANSRGMWKFKNHSLAEDDPFNYLDQIGFYLAANQDNPELKDKDQASFLAVDKELGHLVVDTYDKPRNKVDYSALIQDKQKALAKEDKPPNKAYQPVPDGRSGNYKLPLQCAYCVAKVACNPGLRTFMYAEGPRYLTTVERVPDVPEITIELVGKKNL